MLNSAKSDRNAKTSGQMLGRVGVVLARQEPPTARSPKLSDGDSTQSLGDLYL